MKILVVGGSASGKSEYAEQLIAGGFALGELASEFSEGEMDAVRLAESRTRPRYYIATMEPFGTEGAARIARHREMRRERGFTTIERFTDLRNLTLGNAASAVSAPNNGNADNLSLRDSSVPCVALLEDIGNLVANEVYSVGGDDVAERIVDGVLSLAAQCETLVVVSNDIARDAERYDEEMTRYLALVGDVNRRLAAEFDEVYEVIAGIIERIKPAK